MLQSLLASLERRLEIWERGGYVNSAIERGWLPDNLKNLVITNLEECVKNLEKDDALAQSMGILRRDSLSQIPSGLCEPANTLIPRSWPKKEKELKKMLHESTNLYDTLEILKEFTRRDSYNQKAQDAIVHVALKIADIETLRGNYERAIYVLESVMDDGHVWWDSRKNVLVKTLGYVYASKGDYVRAEMSFKETQRRNVWAIEGGYGALLYNHLLAMSLTVNGRLDNAKLAFERAGSQLPKELSQRYNRGYLELLNAAPKGHTIQNT